jgi:hypothetical protein
MQARKENEYIMDEKKPKVLVPPCAAAWMSRGINSEITINQYDDFGSGFEHTIFDFNLKQLVGSYQTPPSWICGGLGTRLKQLGHHTHHCDITMFDTSAIC